MQYQHGGSRSRMAPFDRGGAYSRGQKQFYPPPPPPPPLPAAVLHPPPPPPQNKYEVLMEAGRLAAEYLVAKGVLPPASLQRGGGVGAPGWGHLPPPPPPPLPAAQEAPAYYDSRNGRRRLDDEYSNPNARSRRNRGGDYNSRNSSNYNGRGKRKFEADDRSSEWGRDRERSRAYSDSRSYDKEDEDGAPGFRKERRGSAGIDEVGSSVSGVAGEGPSSKVEAMGESELEDTGSKVSSNSNVQKNADAPQEVEGENEANKMQEDSIVSNSEVVEQALNGEGNSINASSSGLVQEAETKHLPVTLNENVSDGRPEDSSLLNEKVEDDTTLDEKAEDDMTSDEVSVMENNFHNDSRNLLNYCSFARVPTRPRSVLAHRNAEPAQREISVSEQIDPVSSEEVSRMPLDGGANDNSLTNIQADSKDDLVGQEHTDPSTTCNQVAEPMTFCEKETQGETEEMEEQKNIPQHHGVQDNEEHNELSPTLTSCQNNLTLQVEKGIQIYNLDTPPQDEVLIDPSDNGKTVGLELISNVGPEAVVTIKEEKLDQSSSFKIRDLNLVGSPEVTDTRNDPRLGQCSTAGCSMELDKQQVDFGTTISNNASTTDRYAQIPLGNKAVQVIDIEDDSPIEAGACDTSKAKSDMIYSSMENMMNPPANANVLHGIQDGHSLAISDYLGADMPCYQPIQTDLQAGIGLNDSEGITVMDDSIYGSLSDIGFMEVWDQPPQDYEKFF